MIQIKDCDDFSGDFKERDIVTGKRIGINRLNKTKLNRYELDEILKKGG